MLKARESTPEIRSSYRRRVTLRNWLVVAWLLYLIAIFLTGWVPERLLPLFLFGGVIAFGAVSYTFWRCPACGATLGRSWLEVRCPACHVRFIDNGA